MSEATATKFSTKIRLMAGFLVLLVLVAVILALQSQKIRIFIVVSESMEPTLAVGDRILVDANGYPDRYSVIAFQDPEKPDQPEEQLVKRVIGIEGDLVEIRDGILYVNGEEQYSRHVTTNRIPTSDQRVRVPRDHVFVMGDNRYNSYDSVEFGAAPLANMTGVLTLIVWPPKRWGRVPDFKS